MSKTEVSESDFQENMFISETTSVAKFKRFTSL